MRECIIFWEKARIPTKVLRNCVDKLLKLYNVWKTIQKNSKKCTQLNIEKQALFTNSLDDLFDIAHTDALHMIRIEEDKIFLQQQRKPGRPGCLAGVDQNLYEKENRSINRALAAEQRERNHHLTVSASPNCSLVSNDSDENGQPCPSLLLLASTVPSTQKTRGRKGVLSPKLVGALDRCQLSIRDSVYILQATLEALDYNTDDFVINKSSMQRIRVQLRKERAVKIKSDFKNHVPDLVTVHWDGKLLPAINIKNGKEERLPIVITFGTQEQLIAVPKLENSTGKEQATAIVRALHDWQLFDKVQIMCCDTTSSNTGRFIGACVLLEQKLERDLLLFGCRHHVYELVLKAVFEKKIPQVTVSTDIPFFKKFKNTWNSIDCNNFHNFADVVKQHFNPSDIAELLNFYFAELQKPIVRDDYRELIELSIMFLGGNVDTNFKIRPPGALHQARWMARAIYSLKMCLLHTQLKLSKKEKQGLQDVCLFIATCYVKPWMQCNLAAKAPLQDLCFLKTMKKYERVDKSISEAALNKFCHHLYYLTEEVACLSFFDNLVDVQTKVMMVDNLSKESTFGTGKRYVVSKQEMHKSLYDKTLADFITMKSKDLFSRLKINTDFLNENPSTWESNPSYKQDQEKVMSLKAVNDSAERAVNLMQQFHGLITADEEQKQYLLRCVQDHRKIYPDCRKGTLKRNYSESQN